MESLVLLVLMFLVGGVLQTLAQRKREQRRQGGRAAGRQEEEPQDLLEALRRAYEESQRAAGNLPPPRDESVEEMVEETESLEVEPARQSLERLEARPERAIVDQDESIEATVRRRLEWAEKHAKPISPADHRAFDQAIRAAPPAAAAGKSSAERLRRLRSVVIWQEVLGKPKSLR
jgi:hypothetical protein